MAPISAPGRAAAVLQALKSYHYNGAILERHRLNVDRRKVRVVERLNRRLWAPKVRPEKIWQLYQNDARGLVDETLVDDVGLALYLRCESVLLVSAGRIKC